MDSFDPRLLRRNTDPSTSDLGAHTLSPEVLKGEMHRVWRLVRDHPGKTGTELADIAHDRDIRRVGRRLSDLKRMGWAVGRSPRPCTVTKKECLTWWALERGVHAKLPKPGKKAKAQLRASEVVEKQFENMQTVLDDGPGEYTVEQVRGVLRTVEKQILLRL